MLNINDYLVLHLLIPEIERRNKMRYKVHRFDLKMSKDQDKLEQFLNSLEGEIIAIIPNVAFQAFWVHQINFLYIVEKTI